MLGIGDNNKTTTAGLDGYVKITEHILTILDTFLHPSSFTPSLSPPHFHSLSYPSSFTPSLIPPLSPPLLSLLFHSLSFTSSLSPPLSHCHLPSPPFTASFRSKDDGSVASGLRSRSAPLTRNLSQGALSTTSSKGRGEPGQGTAQGHVQGGWRTSTDRVNQPHDDDADTNSAEISLRKDELEYALHVATGLVSATIQCITCSAMK